jgi:O-antigen ligase
MIKWLFKYGAAIFLFNTVLLAIVSTKALGGYIFLVLMGMYAFILLINPKQISNIIFHKAFSFFLILNIINLSYFLLFHSLSDFAALKYMLARGMQFSIISFSVYYNFEYYKNKFLEHLTYIIFGVIIISLVTNPNIFSGRYGGIIWNPNMLASFTVIGFSALLLNSKKKTNFDYFLLFIFLIISLATGSRGILVGIPLVFVFKFGFSLRNLIYALLAGITYMVIITMHLDTSLNRFAEQSLFNDRLFQYQYAYETFMLKPFIGHGLDKYAYIDLSLVSDYVKTRNMGAHNGYLALLVQYGFMFGSLILGIIFSKSFLFFNKANLKNPENKFYIYLIVYTLLAAVYEAFITGINEFQTILFWFALAFLSYSKFNHGNAN